MDQTFLYWLKYKSSTKTKPTKSRTQKNNIKKINKESSIYQLSPFINILHILLCLIFCAESIQEAWSLVLLSHSCKTNNQARGLLNICHLHKLCNVLNFDWMYTEMYLKSEWVCCFIWIHLILEIDRFCLQQHCFTWATRYCRRARFETISLTNRWMVLKGLVWKTINS